MDVELSFRARAQFDQGGELARVVTAASDMLGQDELPPSARVLTPDEVRAVDAADGDAENEDALGATEVWSVDVEGCQVLFSQLDLDDTPGRLILRVIAAGE